MLLYQMADWPPVDEPGDRAYMREPKTAIQLGALSVLRPGLQELRASQP